MKDRNLIMGDNIFQFLLIFILIASLIVNMGQHITIKILKQKILNIEVMVDQEISKRLDFYQRQKIKKPVVSKT